MAGEYITINPPSLQDNFNIICLSIYSLKDIDLNLAFPEGIDLSTFQSDYKDSCEWEIISPQAERMLLPDNDPDPVAVLGFTLTLERKLVFSSYILTLPCVFLASLTMVVFWLPADRPDRTGLGEYRTGYS